MSGSAAKQVLPANGLLTIRIVRQHVRNLRTTNANAHPRAVHVQSPYSDKFAKGVSSHVQAPPWMRAQVESEQMSPVQDRYARRLKLHVKLQAPGPGERFAVLGSHEAFGYWNLSSGVQLEWRGSAWETPAPIPISPCERVEFKFVRVRPGGLDWESGPNRVTEFPNYKGDLCLQGIFNGESILQPSDVDDAEGISTPDTMPSARVEDDADLWQMRYQEAVKQLTALQRNVANRQKEQEKHRRDHAEVKRDLLRNIKDAHREAASLSRQPPEDASSPESVQSAGAEDADLWKRRFEASVTSLTDRQREVAVHRQELERRRAEHTEVTDSLWRQIQDAQQEARGLSGLSHEEVSARLEESAQLQRLEAPDIATIPSPSFASSLQSTPSRAHGKATPQRRAGLHFSSPRLETGREPPKVLPSAVRREQQSARRDGRVPEVFPAGVPPVPPVGHHSSALETWRRNGGARSSKSETALAALRAAKGASPVSPHSGEEEDSQRQTQIEKEASSSSMGSGQRYERVTRPGPGNEEAKEAEPAESRAESEQSAVVVSKEVAAAFASAKARLARLKPVKEAGTSDD
ncbi:hypothetical protein AK812_SmicGene22309 [Symbiodinium microadriaticum]|uniref:Uncharacterized protein n=1 Tax=Symbiodinium microadriaticum TaxID=2951 RepID=A0A1Q9DK57_SYMMI|nr:hypothetical protein AK812_SmicGene22309 [Symbiodinium microadriaticum]CAE7705263.1 unnamed protein product [Symbiodinium microadriaticum]